MNNSIKTIGFHSKITNQVHTSVEERAVAEGRISNKPNDNREGKLLRDCVRVLTNKFGK